MITTHELAHRFEEQRETAGIGHCVVDTDGEDKTAAFQARDLHENA
jgi:hypothetical protein